MPAAYAKPGNLPSLALASPFQHLVMVIGSFPTARRVAKYRRAHWTGEIGKHVRLKSG